MKKALVLVAAAFWSAPGSAQVHCMDMGGFLSCNGPGGSSTVTILGRESQAAQQGQQASGATVTDFIRGINERKFEKKVGEMLANGDCAGAARYAFEKGRIEIGQAISDRCAGMSARPRAPVSQNLPYEELISLVKRAADVFQPGFELGEGLIARNFRADGGTLNVTTNAGPASNPQSIKRIVCQNAGMQTVYGHGATVAVPLGSQEVRVTRQDCGI